MSEVQARVLLIDDDQSFCKLVTKHLQRAGFDVTCAYSAFEGLAYAERDAFDAIILDHILPEHDGLTFLATLNTHEKAPPVIYLTGSEESRIAVAALKAGASEYVIKDLHGDFLILLEKAVSSAMLSAKLKTAKETADAEIRAARDAYQALAEERALMLREVNHRVSNSLQLIASLLHFQGDATSSADIKAALKEANGRVLAVARVHRSLYTSLDVRFVSLNEYLTALIDDLQDVSAGAVNGTAITISADTLQVGPDTAVAVGIITTELVLNALKHAYPDGQGPVRVELQVGSSHITLTVSDNGVGLNDQQAGKRAGLGQRIIAGMAEKLDGKVEYDRSLSGMKVKLTFPITNDVRLQNAA